MIKLKLMKHAVPTLITVLFLAGCVIGVVIYVARQDGKPIRVLHASWASNYRDLGKLRQASDVVVDGTFTRVANVTTGPEGLPFTDFAFSIKKVV